MPTKPEETLERIQRQLQEHGVATYDNNKEVDDLLRVSFDIQNERIGNRWWGCYNDDNRYNRTTNQH